MKSTAGRQPACEQVSSTQIQTPSGNCPTLPLYKYSITSRSASYPTSKSPRRSRASIGPLFSRFLEKKSRKKGLRAESTQRCTGMSRDLHVMVASAQKAKFCSREWKMERRLSERRLRASTSASGPVVPGEEAGKREEVGSAKQIPLLAWSESVVMRLGSTVASMWRVGVGF
jgi:hypothetical protein